MQRQFLLYSITIIENLPYTLVNICCQLYCWQLNMRILKFLKNFLTERKFVILALKSKETYKKMKQYLTILFIIRMI